jgi:arylsulfatase A-like enzyme
MAVRKKLFGFVLPILVLLAGYNLNAIAEPIPPFNVIVIMTDDLSTDALNTLLAGGYMPNLQQELINQGVWFENAFVTNPVCCPSRATYLTGRYSHNNKVLSNLSPDPFKSGIAWPGWLSEIGAPGQNQQTIATWLKGSGYTTGFIGKYLNGYGKVAPSDIADPKTYIPPGWDDWQGLIDPTTYQVYNYQLNDNGTVVSYGGNAEDYQTDVIAQRAVAFIQARTQSGESFYLNIAPLAPHVVITNIFEILQSMDYREGFESTILPAPRHDYLVDGDIANGEIPAPTFKPAFNEADLADKPLCNVSPPTAGITYNTEPNCVGDLDELRPVDIANLEAQYKNMLASMLAVDDLIGDVAEVLQQEGLENNTAVIFTSDNGWFYGEHRLVGKDLAYEESIRVPLVIKVPGMATVEIASQIALNTDLAPTIAELANVLPTAVVDGTSLVPILQVPARTDWHRRSFLVEHWFIPSLFKFEMATYAALRHIDTGPDYLYVGWRTDKNAPNTITHREFYNHNIDPDQLNSFDLPQTIADTLDGFISKLRLCSGETCRILESF